MVIVFFRVVDFEWNFCLLIISFLIGVFHIPVGDFYIYIVRIFLECVCNRLQNVLFDVLFRNGRLSTRFYMRSICHYFRDKISHFVIRLGFFQGVLFFWNLKGKSTVIINVGCLVIFGFSSPGLDLFLEIFSLLLSFK